MRLKQIGLFRTVETLDKELKRLADQLPLIYEATKTASDYRSVAAVNRMKRWLRRIEEFRDVEAKAQAEWEERLRCLQEKREPGRLKGADDVQESDSRPRRPRSPSGKRQVD